MVWKLNNILMTFLDLTGMFTFKTDSGLNSFQKWQCQVDNHSQVKVLAKVKPAWKHTYNISGCTLWLWGHKIRNTFSVHAACMPHTIQYPCVCLSAPHTIIVTLTCQTREGEISSHLPWSNTKRAWSNTKVKVQQIIIIISPSKSAQNSIMIKNF